MSRRCHFVLLTYYLLVWYRVALARAVYAPTKFVLLDDPLSAVVRNLSWFQIHSSLTRNSTIGQPYVSLLV